MGSVLVGCRLPGAARMLVSSCHFYLAWMCVPTLFLMNLRASLSLETLSGSTACCSQGAKPHTSWVMPCRNSLCLVRRPWRRLAHVLGHRVTLVEARQWAGPEPWLLLLSGCRSRRLRNIILEIDCRVPDPIPALPSSTVT